MVHRRDVDGETLVFGNQGDLFGRAMTWWDHGTGSVWSQPLGEAILGPLAGTSLEAVPSALTTWSGWRSRHPRTLALDVDGWRTGFRLDDMAVAVDLGAEAAAYRIPELRAAGAVNDVVAGLEVVVVSDPDDPQRWAVFSRRLDDSVVDLELTADGLVDRNSGTVFDPFLGVGRSGPLADQSLDKLAAFTIFPADFRTFFPDAEIWPGQIP